MIAETQSRLKETNVLRMVSGAADFEAASETKPGAIPAAFVILLNEAPGPNQLSCGIAQMVRASVGIAIAIANVKDPKGNAAMADLVAVRQAVEGKLFGWEPGSNCSPYEYQGGSLLGFKNGVLWWQDIYSTEFIKKA